MHQLYHLSLMLIVLCCALQNVSAAPYVLKSPAEMALHSDSLSAEAVSTENLTFGQRIALKIAKKRLKKQQQKAENGEPSRLGGIALVTAIVAFLSFFLTPLIGLLFTPIALILSIVALRRDEKKGVAIGALVLSAIVFLVLIVFLLVLT